MNKLRTLKKRDTKKKRIDILKPNYSMNETKKNTIENIQSRPNGRQKK